VALGGWTPREAPATVLGRGGSQAAARSAPYAGTIGRVFAFVNRSALGDGDHGALDCDALKKDLEEHAKFVMRIYDDIDACDEGPTPCSDERIAELFGQLTEALKDQADAIEEYTRKCSGPSLLVG
jgi:hypothetical protein